MRHRVLGAVAAVAAVATVCAGCTLQGRPATPSGAPSIPGSSATAAPSPGGSGGGAGGGSGPTIGHATPGGVAGQLQQAFVATAAKVRPSVVEITTGQGLGSGIIFDSKGDIVTNDHVVGQAHTFQVRLSSGGKALAGTLVGSYPPDDLAVIHVADSANLRPATFADSAKLKVGDIVLAVGNPLGLQSSVTEGIVSATGRVLTEPQTPGSPGATLPDAIQTSAAINPGNSGGALVDLAGQVVGIPTLAAVSQQEGGAAPGIGFAIPSNIITDIASQLIAHGKVVNSHRAALGVEVTTVYDNQTGQPAGVGVVRVTAKGPAATAGIAAGDVIVAVNGERTTSAEALTQLLARLKPGDHATVKIVDQNDKTSTVDVTLGQLPG